MNKPTKRISLFLGVSMFAFGTLKFLDPFKLWYTTQIVTSDLPFQQWSYWAGQLGEILCGLVFILLPLFEQRIPTKINKTIFYINNIAIALMMVVAVYVHLHPHVPSDVLPLKIKPPIIPSIFLMISLINIRLYQRKTPHQ